jgi:hypothetical protein
VKALVAFAEGATRFDAYANPAFPESLVVEITRLRMRAHQANVITTRKIWSANMPKSPLGITQTQRPAYDPS